MSEEETKLLSSSHQDIEKPPPTPSKQYQPNLLFLACFTLTLSLSSMQFGFVMAAPPSAGKALRYQLNWGDNQSLVDFYATIL